MSGFVDAREIPRPEDVTDDMTIGISRDGDALAEHALVDVNRLRRALIEFDEVVGDEDVSLSLIRHDVTGRGDLALVDPDGDVAIVVAGKIREEALEESEQA